MAKGSSNKHQRLTLVKHKLERLDRISSLPDGLLCLILSFLQTKEAVATSVLSTRWRSLWTLVLSLDIDDSRPCFSELNFATIVCQILDQRAEKSIKSVCLQSYHERSNPEFIASVIRTALKEKLEELDLALFFRVGAILPSMLFTYKSITVLKLEGKINLNIPPSVHLPNLKVLHLFARYFVDHEPITRLLSGCPSLEELCCMNAIIDRICVPSLKILIVESHCKKLEIDTPSLEIIRVSETKVIDYEVKSLEKLAEADIDIYFDHEDEKDNIHKLFNGLHKTKYMSFTTRSTEVLIHACINFPEFHNLVHLQLYLVTLDSYFIIQLLLDNSPKLQFLELEKVDECHECEIKWTEPTIPVPSCLSSHLTKFTFREYGCSEEELKLVGYFLRNAKVLKNATIKVSTCLKPGETGCGVIKLCMIPKGSKSCRIDFKLYGLD